MEDTGIVSAPSVIEAAYDMKREALLHDSGYEIHDEYMKLNSFFWPQELISWDLNNQNLFRRSKERNNHNLNPRNGTGKPLIGTASVKSIIQEFRSDTVLFCPDSPVIS